MSATATPLLEFALALKANIERRYVRPGVIEEWLRDMLGAAEREDAREVARLADLAKRRQRLERLWCVDAWLSSRPSRQRAHHHLQTWVNQQLVAAGWLGNMDWRAPC